MRRMCAHTGAPGVRHRLKNAEEPEEVTERGECSLSEASEKCGGERERRRRRNLGCVRDVTSALPTVLFPGTRPSPDARCTYFHKGETISYILGLLPLMHIYTGIVNLVQ